MCLARGKSLITVVDARVYNCTQRSTAQYSAQRAVHTETTGLVHSSLLTRSHSCPVASHADLIYTPDHL